MLRRILLAILVFSTAALHAQAPPAAGERPTLVLAIVVDQMRYDYIPRFGAEFDGGLKRLLQEGAVFTNAHYEAAPTMTAVGHATILTGAPPALSGIVGNIWYDRGEDRSIQSVADDTVTPLGGGAGASPRRLAVSSVGDELKFSGRGGKVFGVSLKDRSAILPAGRGADGAFWFDGRSGSFVSSTYYFPALPAWAEAFNARKPADRFAGVEWMGGILPAAAGTPLYGALDDTPFADQLVLEFALELMEAENLGAGPGTDLLSVSFSAIDYVGHRGGPEAPEMQEMFRGIDRNVGRLLEAAERRAGAGNVLVVFTADHGVAPTPERSMARNLPGGRYSTQAERAAVEAALSAAFGEGRYVAGSSEIGLYLNPEPAPGRSLERSELERVAAAALRAQPHVYRVYTRTDLERGLVNGDRIDQRVRNGFNPLHSGDVLIVRLPNWLSGGRGSNHGSPFSYDTHVPVIFWGPATLVKPGWRHGAVAVHDIAPTLATMLGIAWPNGAIGRTLDEIIP